MKIAHFKDLTGSVDGVNVDFFVPIAFLPVEVDSERLFVRGIARVKSFDDGWDVVDYATGHVRLKEPPEEGDAPPALLFLQDIGDAVSNEVTPLSGRVCKTTELCARVEPVQKVTGCVTTTVLCSQVRKTPLTGVITLERNLIGKVQDC